VDFTLWALMMNPFVASQYRLPHNVRRLAGVAMWGIEEPAEYTAELPATRVLALSRRASEERALSGFVPLLQRLLAEISATDFDPHQFAGTLYEIHRFFESNDYRATFRSRATWEAAKAQLLESAGVDPGDEIGADLTDPERVPTPLETRMNLRRLSRRPPRPQPGNATIYHLPTLNDATEGMRWLYRLLMPLNFPTVEADVVHSSGAAFCGIPAILSKLEYGTPFLLTEHGVYMREQYLAIGRYGYPFYLKKFVVQMIAAVSRTCYALADQVSPVCEYNARWEIRNGVEPERVKVIYNGVDSAIFTPRQTESAAAPTVVSIARVDPLKDLETFLRVAAEVRVQVPNVKFLQYGPVVDKEYNHRVRELWKSLKLEGTVEFRGVTDDPAGAMSGGDVVLLTSISEAFPYAVVEALMCGRPVVSTDVGGVPEALEGVGVLTRPGDVQALAEGVIRLLNLETTARQELRDACRARALNLFTIDAAIEAYRESYMALASMERHITPYRTITQPEIWRPEPGEEAIELVPVGAPAAPLYPVDSPASAVGAPSGPAVAVAAAPGAAPGGAAQALGTLDRVRVQLADRDPAVRSQAVTELAAMQDVPDALTLLSQALKDPSPMVRMAALSAVSQTLGRRQDAG